jgi:hypothetical protein
MRPLREAMEADGKLEVGNWAVQLLHKRPSARHGAR